MDLGLIFFENFNENTHIRYYLSSDNDIGVYNPPLSWGEHGFWCVFYPPPQMAWVVATTHQNSLPDRGGASPFWVGVFEAWVVALLSRVFEAFPENLIASPLSGG